MKTLFPNEPHKWYCVYAIGPTNHLNTLNFAKLYVGISGQPEMRWMDHRNAGTGKEERPVYQGIHLKGWTYEKNCRILFYGTKRQCQEFEAMLRPKKDMGLNKAAGGLKEQRQYFNEITSVEYKHLVSCFQTAAYELINAAA